ncbi:MAG: 50S ribosomal protein L28 [Candidatus Bipolaricaulis sibiricus]|uniref:Large ribosomal subunit protein bL28 n=1 Tax=Bipolaricaulis sibiricus TaxID=2501609 RepID=A0A410FVY2_BIPS1|nr:MAG: 50S ribosomal protein L28 [Candidatus Bipolaricaulis sibiricus]
MARICEICGRGPEFGAKVSHSGRHSRRVRLPNLQRIHAVHNGRRAQMRVCTRCIKAGKVAKA